MSSIRFPSFILSPLLDVGSHSQRAFSELSSIELDSTDAASVRRSIDVRPSVSIEARRSANDAAIANRLRVAWHQIRGQNPPIDLEAGAVIPPVPEEILANTYSPAKAVRNLGVATRKGTFWGSTIFGCYELAQYMMAKNLAPANMATAQGFLYMALPAVVAKPGYDFLEGVYKGLGKRALISAIEAMRKNHENDKAHFAKVQEIISVPEYITKPAKIIDKLIDKDLARFQKVGPENVTADEIELSERRRLWKNTYLTRRPTGLKAVEDWKTANGRAQLDRKVEEALEFVNEADKEFIQLIVDGVCSSSVEYLRYKAGVLATTSAEQRAAARDVEIYRSRGANYIVTGPSGVGKSYAIKHVLGKVVGATVVEIDIPSEEDGGFSALLPKSWDVLHQTGFVPKPADILGRITEALMEGECENVVLYFNEVNARSPLTVDGFKRLLDRVNEFIKNTPLATMFSIASVTIVIDLNPSEENDKFLNDPAVIDRCIVHEFSPAVTPELAEKQLRKAFDEHANASCLPIKNDARLENPHPPVLSQPKQDALRRSFEEVFPVLLEEHMKTTGSARTEFMRMLVPYIAHALRTNRPQTKADIEAYIRQHYLKLRAAQTKAETSGAAAASVG